VSLFIVCYAVCWWMQLERYEIFTQSLRRYQSQPERELHHHHQYQHQQSEQDDLFRSFSECLSKLHDQQATPQLLHNVARKWAILQKKNDDDDDIDSDALDLEKVLEDEVKFAGDMRNKKNLAIQGISWEKIRGLKKVKTSLSQILEWPIKVRNIIKTI
jgi:SpoVK/Ycf46/Vps4 family AAA+-type ATPase